MPNGWKKNVKNSSNGSGKGNAYPVRPKVCRQLSKEVDKFFGRNDCERNNRVDNEETRRIAEKKAQRHAKFVASGQTVTVSKNESRGNLSRQNVDKTTYDSTQLHGEVHENHTKRIQKYEKRDAQEAAK